MAFERRSGGPNTPCTKSLGCFDKRRSGAQALLEVRHRLLVGSGRLSVLMLIRSASALATMRPV